MGLLRGGAFDAHRSPGVTAHLEWPCVDHFAIDAGGLRIRIIPQELLRLGGRVILLRKHLDAVRGAAIESPVIRAAGPRLSGRPAVGKLDSEAAVRCSEAVPTAGCDEKEDCKKTLHRYILSGTGIASKSSADRIVRRKTSAHTARRCRSASSFSFMIGYL